MATLVLDTYKNERTHPLYIKATEIKEKVTKKIGSSVPSSPKPSPTNSDQASLKIQSAP